MRKFLITMMCIVMVVCFMPTVALAEGSPAVPTSGGELSGSYSLTKDTTLSGSITIPAGKKVTITGNDIAKLSLSGTNIIEVKGNLELNNVVIEANNSPSYGAICLTDNDATLSINSSRITQNCPGTGINKYSNTSQIIQVGNVAGPSGTAGLNNINITIDKSELSIPTPNSGVSKVYPVF